MAARAHGGGAGDDVTASDLHVGFTDVTTASGLVAVNAPVDPWSAVAGGAVGDFDGDGFDDVFVLGGGGVADALFLSNGDGTLTDRAAAWGVADRHRGMGAAVADADGDGRLDLYVTSLGPPGRAGPGRHRLYRNVGGRFENIAATAGVTTTSTTAADGWSAAWGDYDADGDLDLAVAGRLTVLGNTLFRNDGAGPEGTPVIFTNVTAATGLAGALSGVDGYTPRFADFDGDGPPELLWIADVGTSRYFVLDPAGIFVDRTGPAGFAHDFSETGAAIADFDGDGDLDVFTTTIATNNLYVNFGGHVFLDFGALAGVADAGRAWAPCATDLDHDGRPDLVVASDAGRPVVFRNVTAPGGLPAFEEQGAALGLVTGVAARGVAALDHDGDGDRDIVLFTRRGPVKLFRNDLAGGATSWLRVELRRGGVPGVPPRGVGARVRARAGGAWRTAHADGGSNYLSQDAPGVHLGLGAADVVDELVVDWTDGSRTALAGVVARRAITVVPPGARHAADVDGSGRVGYADLAILLTWWGPCPAWSLACPPDLDGDGAVGFADLAGLLDAWGSAAAPAPGARGPGACGSGASSSETRIPIARSPPPRARTERVRPSGATRRAGRSSPGDRSCRSTR